MIGIVLGGVLGIATIIYLSLQKPEPKNEKQKSEQQQNDDSNEQVKQEEQVQKLTQEQIEEQQRERKRMQEESSKRKERLLGNLSETDRQLFEGYINELTTNPEESKKQNSDAILVEILLIVAGLLFVYALVVIMGDKFYSIYEIFDILKVYFVSEGSPRHASHTNESPFVVNNPSTAPTGSEL